ncbi:unnamed protein product [Caretta caretta]
MKMCRTILPCILLLFGDVMAVEENIIEATVPDTTGKTTVAPVTEATVPETMGETTVAIVHKDNNLVNLPLGPEKEQQLSGLDLGDVMAVEENITEATIPDTTGKTTVAPVTEATIPDTTGKTTVAPVTEATVPETMGETTEVIVHKDNNLVNLPLGPEKEQQLSGLGMSTTLIYLGDVMAVEENIIEATIPDTTGKTTVAPVTEATVPETMGETTEVIVHKDNNLVNLPLGPGLFFLTHYFLTICCTSTKESEAPASKEPIFPLKIKFVVFFVFFSIEKEQQLSGLVIGLSISFGILLICGVIIYCCIWKKSRKSSFDLNSVEVTIPLNPIETKEPS